MKRNTINLLDAIRGAIRRLAGHAALRSRPANNAGETPCRFEQPPRVSNCGRVAGTLHQRDLSCAAEHLRTPRVVINTWILISLLVALSYSPSSALLSLIVRTPPARHGAVPAAPRTGQRPIQTGLALHWVKVVACGRVVDQRQATRQALRRSGCHELSADALFIRSSILDAIRQHLPAEYHFNAVMTTPVLNVSDGVCWVGGGGNCTVPITVSAAPAGFLPNTRTSLTISKLVSCPRSVVIQLSKSLAQAQHPLGNCRPVRGRFSFSFTDRHAQGLAIETHAIGIGGIGIPDQRTLQIGAP